MKDQQVERQKSLVIGFARTLVQCSSTGDQNLTDQAFENLITAVNSYIAICQFNEDISQRS